MAEEKEKEEIKPVGISRREFLKDAGLLAGGAAVGSMVLANACDSSGTSTKTVTVTVTSPTGGGQAIGDISTIELNVNGRPFNIAVSANETLQEMLREKLGLTSPKDMCFGYGACGSCSVIMNGRPVLSCMVLAVECGGADIETAEGIADAGHPIVDAYIVNHCMQCGYCTPGFLVTSKALLDKKSNPSEADIRKILAGNICRCGTYPAHIRAVLEAAGK